MKQQYLNVTFSGEAVCNLKDLAFIKPFVVLLAANIVVHVETVKLASRKLSQTTSTVSGTGKQSELFEKNTVQENSIASFAALQLRK